MRHLYLAHPFAVRRGIRAMELWVEMTTDVTLVNPFYDLERDDMAILDSPENSGKRTIGNFKALVRRDLEALSKCDGVVCVVPDGVAPIGTICEAWEATSMLMPIYFICGPESSVHPWILWMAYKTGGAIFLTWEEFQVSLLSLEHQRWLSQIHNTAWESAVREGIDG